MGSRPVLRILQLSDSFRSLWPDLAEELGLHLVEFSSDAAEMLEHPDSAASVIAAGGEEDRGLDTLLSLEGWKSRPLYLVGAQPSHRFAIEALRRGATDYFVLPEDIDLLRRTLSARVDYLREAGSDRARGLDDPFSAMIGESPALTETLAKARRISSHRDVTVLIGGETGTGKELLARGIHDGGPRASGTFVAVNCAAIPKNLLESELFGHERGAFTDARTAKPGLFEEAHQGTLFLDEIGHLPLELQGKLLRALDGKRIRRVGGKDEREIDVRIVAASHVDLSRAVTAGRFRQDLFYRLNVVSLQLPPLRERGDDIELLARSFLHTLARRYGLPEPELDTDVRVSIRGHTWPGNVRELRHAIERALLLSDPGTLDPEELVPSSPVSAQTDAATLPFPATLSEINSAAARRMVEACGGNKSEAARRLAISRARLQRLLPPPAAESDA